MSLSKSQRSTPVVSTEAELRTLVSAARRQEKTIGLVPTMGALHDGHLSLVEACSRACGFTVVTIFVNPTQFAPGEDFGRYPRTLDKDLALLGSHGVDLVFTPTTEVMYPPGHSTSVDVSGISEVLEGRHRPGHFHGVATIVLKLFNLVTPDVAYFGQKDFQQSLVVRRMVRDLDLPVEIRVCPTVRDPDGLAMSSRNVYLSPRERQQALTLSRSLQRAADLVEQGERRALAVLHEMRALFEAEPEIEVQYLALVDPGTLAPVETIDRPVVALVAAKVGSTRLIDNWMIEV